MTDIKINTTDILNITPEHGAEITIEVNADEDEIFDQIERYVDQDKITDRFIKNINRDAVLSEREKDQILDEIGIEKCKEYFGLIEEDI